MAGGPDLSQQEFLVLPGLSLPRGAPCDLVCFSEEASDAPEFPLLALPTGSEAQRPHVLHTQGALQVHGGHGNSARAPLQPGPGLGG